MLRKQNIRLAEGLADAEISKVERTFGFRYPPDLREFLQHALPVSPAFPNWREESEASLRERLDWPADGICFDIVNNGFWLKEWGRKPVDIEAALSLARREIANAPILIPIYGHRYVPSEPHLVGNPVLSVYQTDIIYYGSDLADYFAVEFLSKDVPNYADVRKIRFWSHLVEDYPQ